jgi:DNA-binding CsgD family transcriptional regulator
LEGHAALPLTERKIAELIRDNYATKEIADMLFIPERMGESHRDNIILMLDLPK